MPNASQCTWKEPDDGSTLTTNADGTHSATDAPADPVATTQRFDDGSTLTTNPDGTTSSTDKYQTTREILNEAVDKVNRGEVLTPQERDQIANIRNTTEITGGDIKGSVYVETKVQDGALTATNRQDISLSAREGLTHNSTNGAALQGSVPVGAANLTGEVGSEQKQTTNLLTGQQSSSANGYGQVGIERGPAYGQAKVTTNGEVSLTAGAKTPAITTPNGSVAVGAELEVQLPRGNAMDRELAGSILSRNQANDSWQRAGLPPGMANAGRFPLQKR